MQAVADSGLCRCRYVRVYERPCQASSIMSWDKRTGCQTLPDAAQVPLQKDMFDFLWPFVSFNAKKVKEREDLRKSEKLSKNFHACTAQ